MRYCLRDLDSVAPGSTTNWKSPMRMFTFVWKILKIKMINLYIKYFYLNYTNLFIFYIKLFYYL